MPGTGWSDPMIQDQPFITQLVMDAMGEVGPFVMIGSMDNGHERIYQYALDHPSNVLALVPVSFANYTEATGPMAYYGTSAYDAETNVKKTMFSRMITGDIYNFLGVSFGIIELVLKPSLEYVPQELALESTFLNLYNEKQWVTNCKYLYNCYTDPHASGLFSSSLYWSRPDLDPTIAIIGYALHRSTENIDSSCLAYSLSSDECSYQHWLYHAEMNFNEQVIARNPQRNKLVLCFNCSQDGNGFIMDQEYNIPWFANTMMQSLASLNIIP
jgi:hypothetical protein